jgi:muramoyltetrapeptide carboxypeptidase
MIMTQNNLRWRSLRPNDTVDIVAPASGSSLDKLDQGLAWLQELSLRPRYPEKLINTDLFFAAPIEEQWESFKSALYSEAKVIWCLRGGYGSMRLIPLLEKLTPPIHPKLLIGFSDITALHLFFNQKWNWPTLHGRTISQLSPDGPKSDEHLQLIDLLFGNIQEVQFSNLIPLNQAARKPQLIQSTVIGGNLRLLQSSLGTSWELKPQGKILFIEDVSERGYSVDRMLEQLFQANIIHQDLDALIIGDFTEGLEKNGDNLVPHALQRFAERVNYPVLMGMPCGHGKEINAPLPFQTRATLEIGMHYRLTCQTNSI